jgi:hypothetical protein
MEAGPNARVINLSAMAMCAMASSCHVAIEVGSAPYRRTIAAAGSSRIPTPPRSSTKTPFRERPVTAHKRHPIIVVAANPLEDITNVRRLQLVLKEGRVVSDKRHLSGAVL